MKCIFKITHPHIWWWVGRLLGLYYIYKVLVYIYHRVKFYDMMK